MAQNDVSPKLVIKTIGEMSKVLYNWIYMESVLMMTLSTETTKCILIVPFVFSYIFSVDSV